MRKEGSKWIWIIYNVSLYLGGKELEIEIGLSHDDSSNLLEDFKE